MCSGWVVECIGDIGGLLVGCHGGREDGVSIAAIVNSGIVVLFCCLAKSKLGSSVNPGLGCRGLRGSSFCMCSDVHITDDSPNLYGNPFIRSLPNTWRENV
jgi:hypothetical protein